MARVAARVSDRRVLRYGFRPGHSAHQAVAQAQAYTTEGCQFVVDIAMFSGLQIASDWCEAT